ncbi:hypothetical protein [Alkalimonas sp.]|uniref:hypothetical protein n=1 Tax=Alkalimonas sp. TaxID=1872453 RepID=UPI00263AE906|nr:hypothetical protein [Alkalimonas sp.]MCC5826270.1 hypothetical protein [Alkalimonas sp.]
MSIAARLWLTCIALFTIFDTYQPLYAATPTQQQAIPHDFPTVANFFVQADCQFIFLTGYLYNSKSGHWLSSSEARQALPEVAELFTQDCAVQSSPVELAATFNISLPEQEGLLLLYIAPLQGMMETDTFARRYIERYSHHMALLQQLEDIPQYKVTTPLTGYRLN